MYCTSELINPPSGVARSEISHRCKTGFGLLESGVASPIHVPGRYGTYQISLILGAIRDASPGDARMP